MNRTFHQLQLCSCEQCQELRTTALISKLNGVKGLRIVETTSDQHLKLFSRRIALGLPSHLIDRRFKIGEADTTGFKPILDWLIGQNLDCEKRERLDIESMAHNEYEDTVNWFQNHYPLTKDTIIENAKSVDQTEFRPRKMRDVGGQLSP